MPAFLTAAPEQRFKSAHSFGQHQRADALGAADFVRRESDQISLYRVDIKWYFYESLDRVYMQQAPRGTDDFGRLRDRLHRAGFVVGQHHRHQRRRTAVQHRTQMIEVQQAGSGYAYSADGSGPKPPASENRGVLDGRHQQPLDRGL